MAHRSFTVAAEVQDPLTADRLVELLREAGLDGFSRVGGAGGSDGIAAASPAIWDILVPTEGFDRAAQLIAAELATIEREGDENARLAEEEMLTGEHVLGETD
jgi:hypothetical protein